MEELYMLRRHVSMLARQHVDTLGARTGTFVNCRRQIRAYVQLTEIAVRR
jgi:hypothetical protein